MAVPPARATIRLTDFTQFAGLWDEDPDAHSPAPAPTASSLPHFQPTDPHPSRTETASPVSSAQSSPVFLSLQPLPEHSFDAGACACGSPSDTQIGHRNRT